MRTVTFSCQQDETNVVSYKEIKDKIAYSKGVFNSRLDDKRLLSINFNTPYSQGGVLSAFLSNDTIYCQKQDGTINKDTGTWTTIFSGRTSPLTDLDVFLLNNSQITVIADGTTCNIIGSTIRATHFQDKKGFVFYNNTLFAYKDYSIFFSNCFAFGDDNNFTGMINVNILNGKIVALIKSNNILYVVCKNCIYKLNVNGVDNDCTLEKIVVLPLPIMEKSVALVGENLYFISGQKLCVLKNSTISYIDTTLDNVDFVVDERAYSYNENYVLPVVISNNNQFYFYSTLDKDECFIDRENSIHVGNGKLVRISDSAIGQIVYENRVNMQYVIKTNEMLDGEKEKVLTAIYVASGNDISVKFEGDFGSKTIRISSGKRYRSLSLRSKVFTIIVSAVSNFILDDLKLYYRI